MQRDVTGRVCASVLGSLRTDASSATLDPRSPEGRSGLCATPLTKVSGAMHVAFPVSTDGTMESDAHIHAQARDNTVTSSQQHLAPPGCTAPTSDVRREKAKRRQTEQLTSSDAEHAARGADFSLLGQYTV
jgi:hypothetical protein